MAGVAAAKTVPLDAEARKRADEALERELDAEVRRRLDQEKTRMEPAATEAALKAAQKKADEAETRAIAAETAAKAAQDSADNLAKGIKAKEDAATEVAATETLRRARFYAESAKGLKADALDAEAKRLAGLGRAVVDELLAATPAAEADPLALHFNGSAPAASGKADKLLVTTTGGGLTAFTISDPTLTTPGWKPAPSLSGGN